MPLYKRRCTTCNELQDDLLEPITAEMTITCPKCFAETFTKVHCVPHVETQGIYNFYNTLDHARQKASDGHGNAMYRL